MSKGRVALLLIAAAGTQVAHAAPHPRQSGGIASSTPTPTSVAVPTVTVFQATPVPFPTVTVPQPTATVVARPVKRRTYHRPTRHAVQKKVQQTWVWAYLTSYCPGTASWLSSSGLPVFYGMLANDYYHFGTRVWIPVLGMTGVVEDRIGDGSPNHFDVWSSTCYGTPTGYYPVAILR